MGEARRRKVVAGEPFGQLTVVREVARKKFPSGHFKRMIEVRCVCGAIKTMQLCNLTSGGSQSCGNCECANAPRRAAAAKGRKYAHGPAFAGLLSAYRTGARKRELDFRLEVEEFFKLTQQTCYYCGCLPANVLRIMFAKGSKRGQIRSGEPFLYNGIDRIESSKGYVTDNVVPCCGVCNRAKSNLARNEFLGYVKRIYERHKLQETDYDTIPPRSFSGQQVRRRA